MSFSENEMMHETVLPYLEDSWDSLDNVDKSFNGNEQHVVEKLFGKYLEALSSGNVQQATDLESIIDKYETSYLVDNDITNPDDEVLWGTAEADLPVYAQHDDTNLDYIDPYPWLSREAS